MTEKIRHRLKLLFFPYQKNDFRARVLESDFLFWLVLVFFILRIAILPFYVHFPKSIFFAKITSSEIFELLNRERISLNIQTLQENPKLNRAALMKAQDMFEHEYFGHKSPSGISGWHWIEKAGYDYEIAGENLAIGFLDSSEVHQAWNESTLHRENLLSPYFQEVGIAVLTGEFKGRETTIVVQLFGKSATTATPAPTQEIPSVAEAELEEETLEQIEEVPEQVEVPEEEAVLKPPAPEKVAVTPATPAPAEVAPEVTPELVEEVEEAEKPSFQSRFWEFLIRRYSDFLQKAIFIVACFLTLILILNVVAIAGLALPFKRKQVLLKRLVPAASFAVILLVLLGFLDKSLIIRLIPHHLEI